jgi:hypothetical protein
MQLDEKIEGIKHLGINAKLGPQEVAQSARTTLNKVDVTSSNPPPPLVRTSQKKCKIDLYGWPKLQITSNCIKNNL